MNPTHLPWDKLTLVYTGGAHKCYCEEGHQHWIVPGDGGQPWPQGCTCVKPLIPAKTLEDAHAQT